MPRQPVSPPRLRSFAIAAVAATSVACGSSATWTPPPAPILPVAPGPEPIDTAPQTPGAPSAAATTGTSAPGKAPSAIGGELPSDVDGALAARASCKEKECALATMLPTGAGVDAKGPIAVWSHEIAADSALSFPKDSELDVYGVIVKGTVKVRSADTTKGTPAKAWTAFAAPGAGLYVTAVGGPARVVLAVASSGEPVADAAGHLAKDAAKLAWKQRPGAIETVDLGAAKDLAWAGGAMHARIGIEGDKKRASLGALIASKDAPVAQHQHDTSWEILAVLRGSGTLKRASAAGSNDLSPIPVSDGAIVVIPKAVQHAWTPDGTKPLVAIQLYTPPGPEQRFKKLAQPAK